MKEFLKYVAATVTGLICFGLIVVIFGLISVVGMISSSQSTTAITENSVMVLNLQGQITDHTNEDFIGTLTNDAATDIDLSETIKAIKNAKKDDDIKGIYLQTGVTASNIALYQELRNALADFKKSGKWIIAYGDRYSQGAYYVASVADKVYLNPSGMLMWQGLGSQMTFYKDLYAKFGVKYVVAKVGKFKSYTETYTEDKMSDANREQMTRYLQGSWDVMLSDVAKSRNINKDSLNKMADGITMFDDAQSYVAHKLVDGLVYEDQMKDIVKKKLGIDADEKIAQVSTADVNRAHEDDEEGEPIAVYYCQGSIVQQAAQGYLMGSENTIVAKTVCDDLQDLADNDNIKAIVLRINSGGGDAYASEQLWHKITEINKKKPVVVSMSGAAASGAYYMSMGARWVVADPTTITGSIGIFAALPDASGLLTQKLGVKFDEVKTNRNSTFEGIPMSRPFSAEEMGALQTYVDHGYVLFRKRVADGRKLKVDEVEKVAQGRVWLGTDALKLKLVDQLGSLDDAVAKAAQYANVKEYHQSTYPKDDDFMTQLFNDQKKKGALDEQLRLVLGQLYEPFMNLRMMGSREALQARCPFEINNKY